MWNGLKSGHYDIHNPFGLFAHNLDVKQPHTGITNRAVLVKAINPYSMLRRTQRTLTLQTSQRPSAEWRLGRSVRNFAAQMRRRQYHRPTDRQTARSGQKQFKVARRRFLRRLRLHTFSTFYIHAHTHTESNHTLTQLYTIHRAAYATRRLHNAYRCVCVWVCIKHTKYRQHTSAKHRYT